jgi:hypothetical protein
MNSSKKTSMEGGAEYAGHLVSSAAITNNNLAKASSVQAIARSACNTFGHRIYDRNHTTINLSTGDFEIERQLVRKAAPGSRHSHTSETKKIPQTEDDISSLMPMWYHTSIRAGPPPRKTLLKNWWEPFW